MELSDSLYNRVFKIFTYVLTFIIGFSFAFFVLSVHGYNQMERKLIECQKVIKEGEQLHQKTKIDRRFEDLMFDDEFPLGLPPPAR